MSPGVLRPEEAECPSFGDFHPHRPGSLLVTAKADRAAMNPEAAHSGRQVGGAVLAAAWNIPQTEILIALHAVETKE